MDTILPLIIAILLGLGGILCFVTALRWRRIQRGFRPDNVLRVYGTRIKVETQKHYTNPRLGIHTPTELHEFTYRYEVDGKAYTVTDKILRRNLQIPSGTEIVCQRSDPRQCYIPDLTKPPKKDQHHILYFLSVCFFVAMLGYLYMIP